MKLSVQLAEMLIDAGIHLREDEIHRLKKLIQKVDKLEDGAADRMVAGPVCTSCIERSHAIAQWQMIHQQACVCLCHSKG